MFMGDSSDDDDDDGGSEHSAASSEEEQRDSDDSDSEEETGGDRPAELEHVLRQGDMQILERDPMYVRYQYLIALSCLKAGTHCTLRIGTPNSPKTAK